MKKIILVFFLLNGQLIFAENMQFVTILSSPVGTFSQLDTADHSIATVAPSVSFCNSLVGVGKIKLQGANAYLQKLTLLANTSLGGNTAEYRIGSGGLNIYSGGTVTGGRLMAKEVDLTNSVSATSEVADTLYTTSMTVKGAKADALSIGEDAEISGGGDGVELEWNNSYTKDYDCSSGYCSSWGNSYTSYLLKSTVALDSCTDVSYKSTHKAECCPDVPQTDTICYKDCEETYQWEFYGYSWPAPVPSAAEMCQCSSTRCEIPINEANLTGNYQSSFLPRQYMSARGYYLLFVNTSDTSPFLEACDQWNECTASLENKYCVALVMGGSITCYRNYNFDGTLGSPFTSWNPYPKEMSAICVKDYTAVGRCKNGW